MLNFENFKTDFNGLTVNTKRQTYLEMVILIFETKNYTLFGCALTSYQMKREVKTQ